jgi:Protein of unknown function (DUF732)
MSTQTSHGGEMTVAGSKSVSARMLAVLVGLIVAATPLIAAPAPARADGPDDAFINALNGSGIVYDNAAVAKTVAKAICPTLARGGKNVAWNYAKVQGNMPPAMAATFTAIAVRSYCPQMLRNLLGN